MATAAKKNNNGRVMPRTTNRRDEPTVATKPGRLVVLKVLVQPVLVLVDETGAREVQHPVVEVKGPVWAEWAAAAFTSESLEQMRDGITTEAAE